MKEFVKTMCAVICGIIVVRVLGFLFMLFVFGSALAGSSAPALPKSGVLDIDMSAFTLAEQTQEDALPADILSMTSGVVPAVGLHDAVQALRIASNDPSVKYVLLRADGVSGGLAALEEFRTALAEFRQSGKAVIAYTEMPGNGSYYLSSAADKIYMGSQHGGTNMLLGVTSQSLYLKDILDKLGVNVQLIRHGKYKQPARCSSVPLPRPRTRNSSSVWLLPSGTAWSRRSPPCARSLRPILTPWWTAWP